MIKDAKLSDHNETDNDQETEESLGDPRFNSDAPFEGPGTNGTIGIGGGAGGAFGGRRGGHRNLRAGGGGKKTETAVDLALEWLATAYAAERGELEGFAAAGAEEAGPVEGTDARALRSALDRHPHHLVLRIVGPSVLAVFAGEQGRPAGTGSAGESQPVNDGERVAVVSGSDTMKPVALTSVSDSAGVLAPSIAFGAGSTPASVRIQPA